MIRAVVFDFGGVIVNFTPSDLEKFISGFFHLPIEIVKKSLFPSGGELIEGKITEDSFWRNYASSVGRRLPQNWEKIFTSFLLEKTIVNRAVMDIVKNLQKKKLLTPLLSNISPVQLKIFKDVGYFNLFNPLIFSCEVGFKKPDRHIFEFLLKTIHLKPHECLLIDDDENNVDAASHLGMHFIRFQSESHLSRELKIFIQDL